MRPAACLPRAIICTQPLHPAAPLHPCTLSPHSFHPPLPLFPPSQVGTGGLVRDPAVHAECVARVVAAYEGAGFVCRGVRESPIKGAAAGNTEFLAHFSYLPGGGASGEEEKIGQDEGGGAAGATRQAAALES